MPVSNPPSNVRPDKFVSIVGDVSSGSTDAGAPAVKIGGVYNSTKPTYTDGQRGDMQLDSRGNIGVNIAGPNGASFVGSVSPTDAQAVGTALNVYNRNGQYNGTSVDLVRGCIEGQVLASAARTTLVAAQAGPVLNYNPNACLQLYVNVTANGGAFGLTPSIYGRDPVATSTWVLLLAGTKITSNGSYIFTVGRGVATSAGRALGDMLPRNWGYGFAVDDATSVTYSVGYVIG